MATLPIATAFTGSGVTEAAFKTAITDQREFLAGLLGTAGTQSAALTALQAPLNGIQTKTASYSVVVGDRGKLIDCTTAGYSVTLPTVGTAGAGFCIAIRNSASSGDITIGRNSGNIDGTAANITLGIGESTLIICDGSTGWKTVGRSAGDVVPNTQTFTTAGSTNWIKPATGSIAIVECWGPGGSGGKDGTFGGFGGAGGGYSRMTFPLSSLPSTVSVTVGSGGTAKTSNGAGNPGNGPTSFGTFVFAGPGEGGAQRTSSAFPPPSKGGYGTVEDGGDGGGFVFSGYSIETGSEYTELALESTYWSGGAGGTFDGSTNTADAPGSSTNGGDGGAAALSTATAGSQPGGGGGASEDGNSGAGGAGKCIVTVV